jgi:nitroreductase
MNTRSIVVSGIILTTILIFSAATSYGEEMKPIKLLPPQMEGGMPLMQAFKQRHTGRHYRGDKLPLQVMSNLLWAAYGINRPDSGGRTVPTTMDMREFDIYVIMAEGVYVYDPKGNVLQPVIASDLRGLAGVQPYVREAPVNLVYVADYSRMGKVGDSADFYADCDVGFISQDVYLYCASEGLETVVRAWVDKAALSGAIKLKPGQKIILAQSVGYPKK